MHCCCRIVNAICKRLCSGGRISQARSLPPLLRSVVHSVMQAAAHIPYEIRDAPRPTKDGNFDLAGGRWFARDETKHTKVVQLLQQHVGPQERVVVAGTSIPLHAVIHRMLLSLWYMEKCWSNNIGLTNKEVESYKRVVEQFAMDWRALQWQPTIWVHWTCVNSGWFAVEYRNFYLFSSIPTKRRHVVRDVVSGGPVCPSRTSVSYLVQSCSMRSTYAASVYGWMLCSARVRAWASCWYRECGVQDGHPPFISRL